MKSTPRQFAWHKAPKERRHHGHLAAVGKGASGQWQAPGDIGKVNSISGISDSGLTRGDRFDEQFYRTQLCTFGQQAPGDIERASSTGGISDSSLYRGDRFDEQFYKTQLCTFWRRGRCLRQVCTFAHGEAELQKAPDLTKTAMCQVVVQGGTCQDPTCSYAHRLREVRATGSYYKTVMCTFARNGSCKLGRQCRYAHSTDELRPRMEPDGSRLRADPGSMQDLSEVGSMREFDHPDCQGVRNIEAANLLAQVGWEDASGSGHEFVQEPSFARPDAHLIAQGQASHAQEKPYPIEVAHDLATASFRLDEQHKAAQKWTCMSSPQTDVQPSPFLRPVLMRGESAEASEGQHGREAIQVCAQYKEEYAQSHSLQQPAYQMQQPAQRWSCKSSPQADVQPNLILRPLLLGGKSAEACEDQNGREAIQFSGQYEEEFAQKHSLQQPTYQMQQPAYQLPHVVRSHAGMPSNHARQQEVHIGTVPAQSVARRDAHLNAQGQASHAQARPYLVKVAHGLAAGSSRFGEQHTAAQESTCKSSPQADVRPNDLLQPTCQMQQPTYQVPHSVRSNAGMPSNHARQQEVHVGTGPAQLPPGSNRDVSSMRLPGHGENAYGNSALASAWTASPMAPVLGLAESAALPGVAAPWARERAQFSVDVPAPGDRFTPQVAASPQQLPSWGPTPPSAALEPSSPVAMQSTPRADARPLNPTEAILREFQARVLKAAMPDYYED